MKNTIIAIDLAKSVFEIGISDRPGHFAQNHRLSRTELCPFLAGQPAATVVMEACSSSHYTFAVHALWRWYRADVDVTGRHRLAQATAHAHTRTVGIRKQQPNMLEKPHIVTCVVLDVCECASQ